jgi:hypothetical protein
MEIFRKESAMHEKMRKCLTNCLRTATKKAPQRTGNSAMQIQAATADAFAPWPAMSEAAMVKAAALGRRDGLAGQVRDFALEETQGGLAVIDTAQHAAMPGAPLGVAHSRLMLAAVRQCYAAGLHHGGDVRREKTRRGL